MPLGGGEMDGHYRGVQIRSESDSFGTKIFISDWIGLIKLFCSRIGLDFKNEKFILLKDSSDRNSLSKLGSDSD